MLGDIVAVVIGLPLVIVAGLILIAIVVAFAAGERDTYDDGDEL